jgi:hypothetical protein
MDEFYRNSWIRSGECFRWVVSLFLPLTLISSDDLVCHFEIVDLFLSLGSPEVLYQIGSTVFYIFATFEDIVVLPERSDIRTQSHWLKGSQERITYTEIIEIDFFHLGDLLGLVGHIGSKTKYHKTLLKKVDIALHCLLRYSEDLCEPMVRDLGSYTESEEFEKLYKDIWIFYFLELEDISVELSRYDIPKLQHLALHSIQREHLWIHAIEQGLLESRASISHSICHDTLREGYGKEIVYFFSSSKRLTRLIEKPESTRSRHKYLFSFSIRISERLENIPDILDLLCLIDHDISIRGKDKIHFFS